MKTNIFICLIGAVIVSCSPRSKSVSLNKNVSSNIDIEYAVYLSPVDDMFRLDLIIHYPNSIFSFVKQDMMFYSKSNFYVNISLYEVDRRRKSNIIPEDDDYYY